MAMNGAGDDLDLDSDFDFEDLILPEEERAEHQKTKEALQETQKKLEQTEVELKNVKQTFEEEKKAWNVDLDDLSDLDDFDLDADLKALYAEQEAHIQTQSNLTKAVAEVKAMNTLYKIAEERLLRAKEEIESLKSNLNSAIERAQSAEAILQTRDIALATLKQTVERLESDLAAETEKAQSIEISLQGREKELREANQGIEMFRSNLTAETNKKEDAEATLQSRDKELATANQVLEARAKELVTANQGLEARDKELVRANQKIEQLEAQLEAAKNSGFVYNVKRVVNFINRPSVMTGLAVGGIFALATPLTPLAIAGYSVASLIGIEGFKKIRDKFAARHLQAANKANQVNTNHPYFVHGQRAEQEWKAYLNPLWVANFLPSFLNDKSKAFQMGREAKRMEIRNEVAVKNNPIS